VSASSQSRHKDWPGVRGGPETAAEAFSGVALSGDHRQALGRPEWRAQRVARETVEQKAGRYLVEGRLTVHQVTATVIRATCVGNAGEVYHVGWLRGRWGCSCQAGKFGRVCAHRLALQRVVLDPSEAKAAGAGYIGAGSAESSRSAGRRTA
jgi:hypothetical protein